MVGMICTQYSRHFLACPRAISTQIEPGTTTGTEAMAWRTVSAVGPSELLAGVGGRRRRWRLLRAAHRQASEISRITTSRRRTR